MKLSKRDINLLLIVAGLAIFGLAYFFGGNFVRSKNSEVLSEIELIREDYNELKEYVANEKNYKNSIAEFQLKISENLELFPADIKEEEYLVWLIDWAYDNGQIMDSVSIEASDAESVFASFIADADAGETEYKSVEVTAKEVNAVVETRSSYEQVKEAINGYFLDKTRLNTLTVSYNERTGELNTVFDTTKQYINYEGAEYYPVDMPSAQLGQENLFGTVRVN